MIATNMLRLTELLVAVALFLTSAELIACRRDYRRGGVLDPRILLEGPMFQRATLFARAVARCLEPSTVLLFAVGTIVAAAGLAWPTVPHRLQGVFALTALVSVVGTSAFFSSAIDAADHMNRVVLAGLAAGLLADSPMAITCGLAFIAIQSCLSYGTGGVVKLASAGWRSGETLVGIAGSQLFGHHGTFRWLQGHPLLARLAAWGVIVWECAFPIALVAPIWFLASVLAIGVLFHLAAARLMGLNNFVWSFVATYPAIIATNHTFRDWLQWS